MNLQISVTNGKGETTTLKSQDLNIVMENPNFEKPLVIGSRGKRLDETIKAITKLGLTEDEGDKFAMVFASFCELNLKLNRIH